VSPTARKIGLLAGAGVLALIGLVVLGGWLFAFKGVPPGEVCVIQEGGPFDGRQVKNVRQPGSGVANIGIWNSQRCFPSTERNYIISANPGEGDRGNVDFVEVPTLDAVNVRIEGQALFRLTTDPAALKSFYTKFGVRTFDGLHPYESDQGWSNFLAIQVRPVIDNALREAIGQYRCVQLNNTCQYVQNPDQAVTGDVQEVNNSQQLAKAQVTIERTLSQDLNSTLGGPFFTNIRFRLRGIKLEPQVQREVTSAQAKRARVAAARLDALANLERARGRRRVASEDALAIRIKAKSYRSNPAQAQIDKIKAFCGDDGCDPQAVGGDFLNQIAK
jgi:regulator of protease activity HflC (stomatin/prohibitin superfamily)